MHRNQILFHWLLNLEALELVNIPEDHLRAPSDLSWWFNRMYAGGYGDSCGFRMQMVISDRTFAKASCKQIDDGVSY